MEKVIHISKDTPLVDCWDTRNNIWCFLWNIVETEDGFYGNYEKLYHKPSLEEIKDIVISWYNNNITQSILNDFTWKGNKVWLSVENQLNYRSAYDLSTLTKTLPTFKFGDNDNPIFYTFESVEELKEFYIAYTTFIQDKITEGQSLKESIDWDKYNKILNE